MDFSIGKVFGKLTITGPAYKYYTQSGYDYWVHPCTCECGGSKIARRSHLKSGKTSHCGCIRFDKNGNEHESHDLYNTPVYHSWFAMKQRCTNPNTDMYENYGGRGIVFDPKWFTFVGFYNDMGDSYQDGLSIDRIDPNGNYCKENCRWADNSTQGYNQRKSKLNKSGKTGVHWDKKSNKWRVKFTPQGEKTIIKWCEYLWDAIYERMLLEQKHHGYVKE